jgi:NADPH:quinone reductase-like Zn-dependent oxidoreductase
MKAIALMEFGGPEVLEVVELPDPEPGPHEVRIACGPMTDFPDLIRRDP